MAEVPELSWALSPIGSDTWTPMEKRLFKKAFCAHKKDFYLIHKTVRLESTRLPHPAETLGPQGLSGVRLGSHSEPHEALAVNRHQQHRKAARLQIKPSGPSPLSCFPLETGWAVTKCSRRFYTHLHTFLKMSEIMYLLSC